MKAELLFNLCVGKPTALKGGDVRNVLISVIKAKIVELDVGIVIAIAKQKHC
jgi:hypothetical protein